MNASPGSREVTAAALAILGVLGASAALVPAAPPVVGMVAVLASGLALGGGVDGRRVGRLVLRLKWFYLSLAVFYGVWPTGSGGWVPGLQEAGCRIAALMLVVVLVVWLTGRFPRFALVRALGALLSGPRQVFGGWGERFARRLFLALSLFEGDREEIEQRRAGLQGSRRVRLHQVREWLVRRLDEALAGAPERRMEAAGVDAANGDWRVPRGALAWLWAGVFLVWVMWLGGWLE